MFHSIEQNTPEWLELRAGKATGSAIPKIMANDGKAFGEPAKRLAVEIAINTISLPHRPNNLILLPLCRDLNPIQSVYHKWQDE